MLSLLALLAALLSLLAACSPAAQNVLIYRAKRAVGLAPGMLPRSTEPPGAIEGTLTEDGAPLPDARVVVAEVDGTPHTAVSDVAGRYRIEGLPPGWYVPAAVAPGLAETEIAGWVGRVESGVTIEAPPLVLEPHRAQPLPESTLEITATSIVTTVYPEGATALRRDGRFIRDGVLVDTLRCFTPVEQPGAADARPLLLMLYPSAVDGWQDVSVGFASQGFPVLALSPMAARGVDMDAHAQDARLALQLARETCGGLDASGAPRSIVVLAGSFSSAIAYRFLRDEGENVAAWITVGGIADAFSGTADFYAGRVTLPPWHKDAVPALGMPHLHPLPFLRYSPVYNAADLPPTLIIHTAADEVVPIAQARALEAALRAAGVPVEALYYEDTTHYLQIGAQMTDAGRTMFERILAFLHRL